MISSLDLFGSQKQTRALVLLALLEDVHLSELAGLVGLNRSALKKTVDHWEEMGVLVSAIVGNQRRLMINPRFAAKEPLMALLKRLAELDPFFYETVGNLRRRPRRSGKEI